MELRSSRVLKRDKPDIINSSTQNHDSDDKKRLSFSSDKSASGKKRANEVEIGVCGDNANDNVETGTKNSGNTDDKGLFFGSEVLDPIKDLGVSSPEAEAEEESSGSGGEEGNKPVLINSSEKDSGFEEEIAPHISCETQAENVKSGKFSCEITANLLNDFENGKDGKGKIGKKKEKGRHGRKKRNVGNLKKNESTQDSDTRSEEVKVKVEKADVGENGMKRKRGRKRKNVENSERDQDGVAKKEKVEMSGRVLRSRDMTIGGGDAAVDDGRVTVVIGLKRMTKEDETTELAARPNKKLKRRGRPRKEQQNESLPSNMFKTEDENGTKIKLERRGRPRKVPVEFALQKDGILTKVERRGRPRKFPVESALQKDGILTKVERRGRPRKVPVESALQKDGILMKLERRGRPRKVPVESSLQKDGILTKLERRGRPRKVPYEATPSDEIPKPKRPRGRPRKETGPVQKTRHRDTIFFKKLKRRGRPPKMDSKTLANLIKMRTVKLVKVKKGKTVKRVPKIQKIRNEDGLMEVNSENPNPEKVQKFEENSEQIQMMAEKKGIIDKPMKRRECKELVRDKIVNILLNAGWIIDRRPRQEKAYKDKVYIEPSGRSHWSVTRAYLMLKKKIEDGDADSNEISAYTPISEDEISMLFRFVDKVHGYKKKKNKKPNDINKPKIVTKRNKKPVKNTKDGSKRKRIRNSISKSLKNPNRKKGIFVIESKKPRLLARSSEKVSKQDNDGCLLFSGKRNLLSWMIDLGVILAGCKVQYGKTRRQKKSSEGVITSDGICCSCCNEIMGVSRFVGHAGGRMNQPFDNVYLESGTSVLKCLMDSWRKEEELNTTGFNRVDVKGDDPNDDTCNICGDGGNLICCDGCPSTFHQNCLDIQNFPSGDWNCIYCSCKFCGVVSVITPQLDDSRDELTSEMLSCGLCEEKFHLSCLQEEEVVNVDSSGLPFCGRKCREIFERLQTCLGVKVELEDGFSWTLLQRSDVGQDLSVHDTQLKVERNSKLAVAFSVMDECFVPIIDERSGTSIIRNVVYNCGSNFRRLDYAGFLTAILEKDDELITAASIRIHGHRLAEMPFIGTRHMYRRQGMCRRLLDAIESTLSSIGVEELIIPAIPELLQTWTKVFGFMHLEESKRQAMKSMNMLVFPGVNMLQKPLLQNPLADRSPNPSEASDDKAVEHTSKLSDNHSDASEVVKDETVLMDVCSCPDLNNKTVYQLELTASNAIDCNQRPVDATEERTEEPTVLTDGCSRHEEAAAAIPKDGLDHEPLEETTGLTGGSKEDISHLENGNGLCDLNLPVKINRCRVAETDGLCRSLKLDSGVENGGISGAESSPPGSELAPKNAFDLNLHPTAVDIDTHIVGDDSLANEPCRTSFELSETRSRVENGDSKPCDTQPLIML